MIVELRSDLIGIHQTFVWHYLLLEDDGGVVALDAGFGTSGWRIRRWLKRSGRGLESLRAILLTHAHVDHAGCAAALRQRSNASIHLHPDDARLLAGKQRQPGMAKIGEWSERLIRPLVRYGKFRDFEPLADGQELPFWGGLRVVHLPGHTPGHVGFYSPGKRIFFAGDAILSRGPRCFFPARMLNADHPLVRESILKIVDLDIEWIYPGHHRQLRHNLMDDVRRFAEKRRVAVE